MTQELDYVQSPDRALVPRDPLAQLSKALQKECKIYSGSNNKEREVQVKFLTQLKEWWPGLGCVSKIKNFPNTYKRL